MIIRVSGGAFRCSTHILDPLRRLFGLQVENIMQPSQLSLARQSCGEAKVHVVHPLWAASQATRSARLT
jgi:hypothetical protein